MAIPWFQAAEVKSRIENLHPESLDIRQEGGRFIWVLPDDLDAAIERVITKQVDSELGYSFGDYDGPPRDRWIEVYEQQSTVQAHLNRSFGDPNVLVRLGIGEARRSHKQDPGRVKRLSHLR